MDINVLHQELVAEAEHLKGQLAPVKEMQDRLVKITYQAQALNAALIVMSNVETEDVRG